MDFMDGLALRSRQPSGPCRSQNRSSRRRVSLSRHYCDPAPCLASSRDRPWNRHCKELDRCSFIRDATIGRTSTIRPRVGRQRHQWPAVKGWRRRWGTWICFQDEAVQILRPPKPQHGRGALPRWSGCRARGSGWVPIAGLACLKPSHWGSSPADIRPQSSLPNGRGRRGCVETAGQSARLHRIGCDTGRQWRFESGGAGHDRRIDHVRHPRSARD
jgi:hypothetical protein